MTHLGLGLGFYPGTRSIGSGGPPPLSLQLFETGTTATTNLSVSDTTFFGGTTPSGSLLFGSYHEPANDPNETAHALLTLGIAPGTENAQRNVVARSQDGVASTETSSAAQSGETLAILNRSANAYLKRFDATSTANGLTVARSTNTDANMRGLAMMFDSATQFAGGQLSLGTGTSAIPVAAGFQPDFVIVFGNNGANAAFGNFCGLSYGIATATDQRCAALMEGDAIASGSPRMALFNDATHAQVNESTGALVYKCTVGNFSASGFDITPSASASSDSVVWAAVKLSSRSVKLMDLTTPTSTGSQAVTGVGFWPSALIGVLTNLEAMPTVLPVSSTDLCSGLSLLFATEALEHSVAIRIDAGADPTDTASNSQNAFLQPSATSTASGSATLTSFNSDGMTLNWSAVQGTAKKGFALFIQ